MTETTTAGRADPLIWGRGSRVFEVFLEPTCPYSAKALGKLDETLRGAGPENVSIRIWLHSQPWHLFSGVIARCALAASTLADGKEGARKVLTEVAAHRDAFEPVHPCSGPIMAASPVEVIARIEKITGLKLADAFAVPTLDREIKRHAKYSRQNGIHVSPTFMIDGLIQQDMSSGDSVSDWIARLSAG